MKLLLIRKIFIIVIVASIFISCKESKKHFSPVNLKCESPESSSGIDAPNPRLAWQMNSENEGASHEAYIAAADLYELYLNSITTKLNL